MSILELFCSVDDFWQQFAPTWQQDLLTSGERQRVRPGQMYRSRNDDHCHPVPAVALSHIQSLLHRVCPPSSVQRISHPGELFALRIQLMPTVLVPLVAYLHTQLGRCDFHQLHRLHPACRLSQRSHSLAIASLMAVLLVARPRWAGFTASSCTWSSTIKARSWRSA